MSCLGPRKRWTSAYIASEITVSPKEVEIPPTSVFDPRRLKSLQVKAKEVEIPPSQGKRPLKPRQAQAKPSEKGSKSPQAEVEIPSRGSRATLPRLCSKLSSDSFYSNPSSLLFLFIDELALTPYHPIHTHVHTPIPYPRTYSRNGGGPGRQW